MANILLVEPDSTLGPIYQAAIESDGDKVLLRRTAESGVKAMDEIEVDLIVLELNIALHNGIEFLYELRSYPEWSNKKVILHTNVREKQIDNSARQKLGIISFLYKPTTSLKALRASIKDALLLAV